MTETLQLSFPKYEKSPTIIIEAGHIYTNETPSLEHTIGAYWGSLLGKVLSASGATVKNWLFVDNYNPQFEKAKQEALNLDEYLSKLRTVGFAPDQIEYEADLTPKAEQVKQQLVTAGLAGPDVNSGNIILYKNKKKGIGKKSQTL